MRFAKWIKKKFTTSNKLSVMYVALYLCCLENLSYGLVREFNKSPNKNYKEIKRCITEAFPEIIQKINTKLKWPDCIPSLCTRIVAHQIESSSSTFSKIQDFLRDQSSIQVRLNKKKWLEGEILFDVCDRV